MRVASISRAADALLLYGSFQIRQEALERRLKPPKHALVPLGQRLAEMLVAQFGHEILQQRRAAFFQELLADGEGQASGAAG